MVSKELISNCLKGNQVSQSEMFKLCYSPLMSICTRYKSDNSECQSLVNLGFYKILKNLEKYQSHVPFEAWIKRIMINCVIDEFRKNKKYKDLKAKEIQDGLESNLNLVNYNEAEEVFEAEELRSMLLILPERTRQVFNLYAIDGYMHKEISQLLGISESTSKWHLAEARKALKIELTKRINKVKTIAL